MSYCAVENTVKDLEQVLEILRQGRSIAELIEESSSYEAEAIKKLPKLCEKILDCYVGQDYY